MNEASVVEPFAMVTVELALTEPLVVTIPCVVLPNEPSKRPPMPKMLPPEM